MSVRMRGPGGETVDVPDDRVGYYRQEGFTPLSVEQESQEASAIAAEADDRGVLGSLSALGSSALSGASLGLSDMLIGSLSTQEQREQLVEDRRANPILSTVGEIGGGLATSFAAPGSLLARTPAGVLAQSANRGVEAARAIGGAKGFAGQAAITGAEAAAQNVGSYLGSVALGDRKLTAEGLGGALGSGFALGAAGGAAVYGLEKGSIAARRLFSSVMEGGDDAALRATGEWERKWSEISDANKSTLDEARRRVDEATAAAQQAALDQQRAAAYLAQERAIARRAGGAVPPAGAADDALPPPASVGPDAPAPLASEAGVPPAGPAGDPIDAMMDRIRAGEVPGEAGPFSPDGLRAAAERELRREEARASVGGFDFAPRTGSALSEARKGGVIAEPAPLARGADEAAPSAAYRNIADDEFAREQDAFSKALTPEETDDVMKYTNLAYGPTNTMLRQGKLRMGREAMVANVDSALSKARTTEDMLLYRGIEGTEAEKIFADLKPGDSFTDRAYGSTSIDPKVAQRGSVFMEIEVPKGYQAAPIPSTVSAEKEYLLRRNAKYEILDIGEAKPHDMFGTERRIRVRLVPDAAPPPRVPHVTADEIAQFGKRGDPAFVPSKMPIQIERLADKAAAVEAAAADLDPLMRALMGTKAQLDDGAALASIGIAAKAGPMSPRQLADEIDRLTAAAAEAPDAAARQALLRQASALEEGVGAAAPSAKALTDLDTVTQALSRYEKAVADLVDDLGDGAHPLSREMADGLRKAEGAAEGGLFDRVAQSMDDHFDEAGGKLAGEGVKTSTQQGGGEVFGPESASPKERVAYAKALKADAGARKASAKVAETEARMGLKSAQRAADEQAAATGRAVDTVSLSPMRATEQAASPGGFGAAGAADVGGIVELMGGIPGMPKPSDIPIIGPALGLFLKARALKVGVDRLMGRVPATGNAKVASLAAATKDKAARVVDKMLSMVERKAPQIRSTVAVAGPALLDAVSTRLHDDGTKAPPKDAGLAEHVGARSREIGALAANPALIAKQVRREMRGVADPEMVAAAIEFRTQQIAYLDKVRPKEPPPSPFRRDAWKPDKAAATDFARRYAVAMDPIQALEQVEQRCITPESAEAFRAVYPLLFQQTQARMLEQATKLQTSLPRPQLTRMSILFGLPLDEALGGEALAMTQATFATSAEPAPADATAGAPPVPSIAGGTDLGSMFGTSADRRAAR